MVFICLSKCFIKNSGLEIPNTVDQKHDYLKVHKEIAVLYVRILMCLTNTAIVLVDYTPASSRNEDLEEQDEELNADDIRWNHILISLHFL